MFFWKSHNNTQYTILVCKGAQERKTHEQITGVFS